MPEPLPGPEEGMVAVERGSPKGMSRGSAFTSIGSSCIVTGSARFAVVVRVRARRMPAAVTIDGRKDADEAEDNHEGSQHGHRDVALREELPCRIPVSARRTLRESDGVAFELGPRQLCVVRDFFQFAREAARQPHVLYKSQVVLATFDCRLRGERLFIALRETLRGGRRGRCRRDDGLFGGLRLCDRRGRGDAERRPVNRAKSELVGELLLARWTLFHSQEPPVEPRGESSLLRMKVTNFFGLVKLRSD